MSTETKQYPLLPIALFNEAADLEHFYFNTLRAHLDKNHQSISKAHKHDFYLFVLFTKGSGTHEIDFETYEVKENTAFFLNPGQVHSWTLSEDVEGYIFFHTKDFYDTYFSNRKINLYPFFYLYLKSPLLQLDTESRTEVVRILSSLETEYQSDKPYKKDKILNLIDGLYLESARHYLQGNGDNQGSFQYNAHIERFENLLEAHYKEANSASYYAERMNISSKHLNRIIQEFYGKTSTDVITDRVILEAKRLLVENKHNFQEIALLLGFEDYPYFNRVFKRKTGFSPRDFVKNYH